MTAGIVAALVRGIGESPLEVGVGGASGRNVRVFYASSSELWGVLAGGNEFVPQES